MSIFYIYCVFCKQKTAYEIYDGLVGSEMCIRDSSFSLNPRINASITNPFSTATPDSAINPTPAEMDKGISRSHNAKMPPVNACLLYTSDAADERSSVDLGGRRIIKKKTHNNTQHTHKHIESTHEKMETR